MVRKDHIVKVLDFGLAKLSEPPALTGGPTGSEDATRLQVNTTPGLIMGTVSYMSPEQSRGSGVDHRTDIWSVGVVLYEMIAGVVPFQGKDVHRQIIAIQESEPPPLSQQVEGAPERLEEIVTKCLAKDKGERYQTAKDLLIDLRNLRRKLDVDAEIERTVAPEFRRSPASGSSAGTQRATIAATTSVAPVRTASSAEYIVTGIKQHKLVVPLAIVAVTVGGVLLWWYLHARNTEVAIESIAVLPFENQNRDPNADWLSDGVTESIINSLTQFPNLRVIARSSVFRYKGKEVDPLVVGKELGVRAVLVGRMMQRGDNVTISAELVDVRDNKQLWGEQYERKVSDLMSVQRDIAGQITNNLRLTISGEARNRMMKKYTDNSEAYQLYLKGLFYWNKRTAESLKTSIDYFNQAIEKDPNYAQAHAGMALAYVLLPEYSAATPADAIPKAKAAATKALQLDETLAEAHTALAHALLTFDRNLPESNREFQRAIELNPNYATAHQWYSNNLVVTKRFDETIAEGKRAIELDPLSLIVNGELAINLHYMRQYDQAIAQFGKTLALDKNWYVGHQYLCQVYDAKGLFPQALAECQKSERTG
jgi:serine/threonine-protein kinase